MYDDSRNATNDVRIRVRPFGLRASALYAFYRPPLLRSDVGGGVAQNSTPVIEMLFLTLSERFDPPRGGGSRRIRPRFQKCYSQPSPTQFVIYKTQQY